MKSDSRLAGLMFTAVVALSALVWTPDRAAAAPRSDLTFTLIAEQPTAAPISLQSLTARLPGPEEIDLDKTVKKLPTFTRNVTARGKTYKVTLVGSDPFVSNARGVTVPMQIVPVRFELDSNVFDPSLPSPECAGGGSAVSRVMESPLVKTINYGDGKRRQYHEEVRRREFWSLTGAPGAINPGYSVRLAASVLPTVTVKISGAQVVGADCGKVGLVNVNDWDDLVQTQILPALRNEGVSPKTFPVFLGLNIWLYDGNVSHCCFLGYHNAFNGPDGVQTYAVADYDITQILKSFADVSLLSHEIAAWYDDPFGKNPAPSWGHVGQATGCEESLDVAAPLPASFRGITMPNGFTYHVQEVAFFSWFYNQVPSLGVNGWYSSEGTFRAPASLCK